MSPHGKVEYYAPDQVILQGTGTDLQQVLNMLPTSVNLQIVEDIPLGTIGYPPEQVLRLYRILGNRPVEDVVAAIQQIIDTHHLEVLVDLNYRIGRPPLRVAGDPWGVEGSPWGVEGSPWGVEGSPWLPEEPVDPDEMAEIVKEDFNRQWALGPRGIHVNDDDGTRRLDLDAVKGQGVRVGVFDTSPFTGQDQVEIGRIDPLLTLHLSEYTPCWQISAPDDNLDLVDHGLFVAGLVHAVAPESHIHLIRVLDRHAQGDIFTLGKAVFDFIDSTQRMRAAFTGAVINLSLGVQLPPGRLIVDRPARALIMMLVQARRQGIVIAAAAGNDSWTLPPAHLRPTQLPAGGPAEGIIAVQASDIGGMRACFSNRGEIAAPGCGLLSLTRKMVPEKPYGYAYWAGTSFATPLVSGLAALHTATANWDVQSVVDRLMATARHSDDDTLPGGIANMPS